MHIETLSVEDVIRVHEIISADFARTADPISPSGVRSRELLESAVGRQFTGSGAVMKYPDPISNAATLVFGICCDHPFLNGNKRTALIAGLAHLDRNRLALYNTSQKDLYDLMLSIANHTVGIRQLRKRGGERTGTRRSSDEEVSAIAEWLRERAERVRRGERQITYRQARSLIEAHGFVFLNERGNAVDVMKLEVRAPSLLRKRPREEYVRVGTIGYRDEGTVMSIADLKKLRKMCRLSEGDGVDSDSFYNAAVVIDSFVNRYRTVLRRLARV